MENAMVYVGQAALHVSVAGIVHWFQQKIGGSCWTSNKPKANQTLRGNLKPFLIAKVRAQVERERRNPEVSGRSLQMNWQVGQGAGNRKQYRPWNACEIAMAQHLTMPKTVMAFCEVSRSNQCKWKCVTKGDLLVPTSLQTTQTAMCSLNSSQGARAGTNK